MKEGKRREIRKYEINRGGKKERKMERIDRKREAERKRE